MAAPESAKKINPEILWLLVIFALALAMRTLSTLTRDMVLQDEATYLRMAENLLNGRAPYDITGTTTTHFGILYPLVTASFAVVTRNISVAAHTVSILFGSLLVLPTYLFGKVMWNMRVGRAAAALVAVLPALVIWGGIIDGHNLFAFWLLCALFFGYRMQFTKRCMCGMLSGTCLGLAYLDYPSALYYLVTLFVLLVIVGFRQELSNYANKAAVHFMLMFLLFAIPNVAFLTWQNGSFTVNDRDTDEIYASVNNLPPASLERESDMYALTSDGELRLYELEQGKGIITSFVDSPGEFTRAVARDDYSIYFRNVHRLVPVWLLLFIGLGLFKFSWTRREALKYGYFAMAMAPLVVLPITWVDERFALPYLGIVMLAAARGWVYLDEWSAGTVEDLTGWKASEEKHKQWVQGALAVLVLVPLAALSLWNVGRVEYPTEFKEAGQWLEGQGGDEAKIMSRESSTSWYSGGTQLVLPYASIDDTLDYAQRHDAGYFVVSRRIVDDLRPQLEPLMNEENRYRSRLEPVYHSGQGTESELILYRVRGT